MKITLEGVRNLLCRTLGSDSFAAGFITRITEDPATPTASIDPEGTLRYGPDFVDKYIKDDAYLFCLVIHEMLHPAFGHMIRKQNPLVNLASDAIINAAVTVVFPQESRSGCLYRELYPKKGLGALLRPNSSTRNSRYNDLYTFLYPQWRAKAKISTGEVIQTLQALAEHEELPKVLLLGTHESGEEDVCVRLPEDVCQGLCNDLKNAVNASVAGQNSTLVDLLLDVLQVNKSFKTSLLEQYACRRVVGKFCARPVPNRRITSPFPINPSRRDMILLGSGVWPGLFRNRMTGFVHENKGVVVFLDVSGSVNEYLPHIAGLLVANKGDLGAIYGFSNETTPLTMSDLCAGKVSTTYGTDFDCVAATILEEQCDKALIFTDGCAAMTAENAGKLKKAGVQLLTVLFGRWKTCKPLEPFGRVMQLDDVVD